MTASAPSHESCHAALSSLAPHRHAAPYAALVLDGSYEEASMDGRFACSRGTLVLHPSWHAHGDSFGAGGAVVLNIARDGFEPDALQAFQVPDPDAIAMLARTDPVQAAGAALEEARPHPPLAPASWLVRYVDALFGEDRIETGILARRIGVSPEHASRACKTWFGLSPSALRREGQLHRAIATLRAGGSPSAAAHEGGFCDQPHLTRFLKRMTGLTPARLRCA